MIGSFSNYSLDSFRKALDSLEAGLYPAPKNDRERDGAIQRYEYCLELCWKLGQKYLASVGITSNSPKSVFRDLGQQSIIVSVQTWIDYVDLRNETSHLYHQAVASRVFAQIEPFYKDARELLKKFEASAKP